MLTAALIGAIVLSGADTVERVPAPGPRDLPVGVSTVAAPGFATGADALLPGLDQPGTLLHGAFVIGSDTVRRRVKAIEISDAYATRLKIHKIASYATIPLFAAQYLAGTAIWDAGRNNKRSPTWATDMHRPIGYALGALFVTNSVTGSMNWWETRGNEKGRTWRTVHAALMLASDAGFAYAANVGTQKNYSTRANHRQWAIASLGAALTSYVMMLEPLRRD